MQRLTQQQMLVVKLLEMPLTEFEQNVTAELDDNPALESREPDADNVHDGVEDGGGEADDSGDFDAEKEREERESALADGRL